MSDEPRVTMYGRPGCHLCEQAREVIRVLEAAVRSAATGEVVAF